MTLTSGFSFRKIVTRAYISPILFEVKCVALGFTEYWVLFLGHLGLDLWPQS